MTGWPPYSDRYIILHCTSKKKCSQDINILTVYIYQKAAIAIDHAPR